MIEKFFEMVGFIYLCTLAYRLIIFIRDIVLPGQDLLKVYGKGWAVVTGSTDGIGKGFCLELGKRGFNICLIARNQEKAEGVVAEIKALNSSVRTQIIKADFVNSNESGFFKGIEKELELIKNDIAILVNNVGMEELAPFDVASDEYIRNIINVNVLAGTLLTKLVLPWLLQRKQRSAIINLSSFTNHVPFPFDVVYGATKKFNNVFSTSLTKELDDKIEVMSLKPLYVTTSMTHYVKGNGAIVPLECAKGALKQLGRESSTNGHFSHKIQQFILTTFFPYYFLATFAKNFVMGPMYYKRLKKQQQQKQQQQEAKKQE